MAEKRYWYAIKVAPNREGRVRTLLALKEFEVLLPVCRVPCRSDKAARSRVRPLFPGYVFCWMAENARYLPILQTPGVVGFVCFGASRATVEDAEIEAIREVAASGLPAEPYDYLAVGQDVAIAKGPLAGLTGVLVSAAGRDRFVVSVRLLRRSVAVEIDRSWTRPCGWAEDWSSRVGERIEQRRRQAMAAVSAVS